MSRFAQGATLVPRNMYFIDVPELSGNPNMDTVYRAHTNEEQARASKQPWRDVRMEGRVEGRFLFAVPLARQILPFAMLTPNTVFLPYERSGHSAKILGEDRLNRDGWRHAAKWMQEAGVLWKTRRPNSAAEMSAAEWLNYHDKLTNQTFRGDQWLVIYNHSGTNVAACYVPGGGGPLPLVMDAKVYYAVCDNEDEAAYLTAVLNSRAVNDAIKPFQSTGLQGERDVHTKPLELPIPAFDERHKVHAELARLGREATASAAGVLSDPALPTNLAGRRRVARERVRDLLLQIDKRVVVLLGLAAR